MVISLAMPREPGTVLLFDSAGVMEWIKLMRGVKAIVELAEEGSLDDSLRPATLMRQHHQEAHLRDPASAQKLPGQQQQQQQASDERRSRWYLMHEPPLQKLREHIAGAGAGLGPGDSAAHDDAEARRLSIEALDQLRAVFGEFLDTGECILTMRLIFSWSCNLDERFLRCLSRHSPHALLVFCHFGVLLHWIDRAWWLDGWGTHLVSTISGIIERAEGEGAGAASGCWRREWLKWPREQIGLPAL